MSNLKGKTVFITGASRGIGLAIAIRAARDGANVVIAAKSDVPNPKLPGTIHSAAAAVAEAGGKALAIRCDIREEDQVKAAVADVLTQGGYSVDEDETGNVTTGMRREVSSPWNWLLRWRFGVGKSRVEARVVPQDETTTRLRLQVFHRGKDGLFDTWEDAETPLPQSAANEIRRIKNVLRLL